FSRRSFLKLMGASLALAGLNASCARQPEEAIVPYAVPPEQMVAGQSLYFASTMPVFGYGRGVIVESREGRPIKIEGNPDHPSSLGGTDPLVQASVLGLYDPDRSKLPARAGNDVAWSTFFDELRPRLAGLRETGGAGLRVVA